MEGSLKNEFLYNDKELWDDADLNWYDYGFRNYDAQNLSRRRRIARFTQLDPLTWDYPELTNYQYSSDEPIANVDMDGLEKISTVGGWWNGAYLSKAGNAGASVGNIVAHSIVRSANVAINQINRTSQDNTYLKIPVQNLQLNTNDFPLNQQQATVGPAKRVIRSKQEQAFLDKVSKDAEQDALRRRREKANGYRLPVMGDLFTALNRIYYGDFGGAVQPAVMFSLNTVSDGAGAAADGGRTFFEGAKYSDKVLRQMSKADDIYHAFPKSVDSYATKFGKWSTKLGEDGKTYQWLKMPGSYGGKTGVFEYTKDANGLINHRFFNVPKSP